MDKTISNFICYSRQHNNLERKKTNIRTLARNIENDINSVAYPCPGVLVGGKPAETLNNNWVNIESNLQGITFKNNNCGYQVRQWTAKNEAKNIPSVSFFDRPTVYIPEPLVIEENQRPFIIR